MLDLDLASTNEIVENCEYFDTPAKFFGEFVAAWASVNCQVAKLESRQTYSEPENTSLREYLVGERKKSLRIMEESLSDDDKLYEALKSRNVEFVRCRPILFPVSDYLNWELQTYRFTSQKGERILCCNLEEVDLFFDQFIFHDFMVFDARLGFVHDYDENGLIRGGWKVDKLPKILELLSLFSFVKANCRPFELYLGE